MLLISSDSFIQSTKSLIFLSIALFFFIGAYFWGQAILVVDGKENTVFFITIASAVLNIVLNFILIPFWGEIAAGLTTVLSEMLSYFLCMFFGRKIVKPKKIIETIIKAIVGSAAIVGIYFLFNFLIPNRIAFVVIVVLTSIVLYFAIEFILRNKAVTSITDSIKKKFSHKEEQAS